MRKICLISLDVLGIKSLEKPIHLDFYKKIIDRSFDFNGYRVKGIYGENGSGKTSIVTAVKLLKGFILSSFKLSDSDRQILLGQIVNNRTNSVEVACEFLIESEKAPTVYRYSFELTKDQMGRFFVHHESLSVRNATSANTVFVSLFECIDGKLVSIKMGNKDALKVFEVTTNLIYLQSFVSTLFFQPELSIDIENDAWKGIVETFLFAINLFTYLPTQDDHDDYIRFQSLDERILSDEQYVTRYMKDFFMRRGSGMHHVAKTDFERYKTQIDKMSDFVKLFKPDLHSIDIDSKINGESYECRLLLNYGDYSVDEEFESAGIKKLMSLFDYFVAAAEGSIVFIDEMDANINDIYLSRLIEYFGTYSEGQLCFTVHNLGPMEVLNEWNKSIDFLTIGGDIVSWKRNGNASPVRAYRGGMIEGEPFNIYPADFVGILGD